MAAETYAETLVASSGSREESQWPAGEERLGLAGRPGQLRPRLVATRNQHRTKRQHELRREPHSATVAGPPVRTKKRVLVTFRSDQRLDDLVGHTPLIVVRKG